MGKAAFDQIIAGLEDALAYAEGDKARGVPHTVQTETEGGDTRPQGSTPHPARC